VSGDAGRLDCCGNPGDLPKQSIYTPNSEHYQERLHPFGRLILMGRNRRPQPLSLASKLLEIRTRLKLTQVEMAKRLTSKKSPVHPGNISEYELGKREPSLLTLLRYAKLAGVSMEVLVDDEIDLPRRLPGKPKHKN
jgi:DNA-binding XRE family transcriptional regulator